MGWSDVVTTDVRCRNRFDTGATGLGRGRPDGRAPPRSPCEGADRPVSTARRAAGSFPVMDQRVSTVTLRGLRDAPDAGLSGPTSPEARLALVETLTREAWALAGGEPPPCARRDAPVALRPLRPSRVSDRPTTR